MKRLLVFLFVVAMCVETVLPVSAQDIEQGIPVAVHINGNAVAAEQVNSACPVSIGPIDPVHSTRIEPQQIYIGPFQIFIPTTTMSCPALPVTDGFMGEQPNETIVLRSGGFARVTGAQQSFVLPNEVTTLSIPITGSVPSGILPLRITNVLPFDEHAYGPFAASLGQEYPENEILDAINRAKDMATRGIPIHLVPTSPLYTVPIFRTPHTTPGELGYEEGVTGFINPEIPFTVEREGSRYIVWASMVYHLYSYYDRLRLTPWIEFEVIWETRSTNEQQDVDTSVAQNRVRYQVPVTVRMPNGSLEPGIAWFEGFVFAGATTLAIYGIVSSVGGGRFLGGGGFFSLADNFEQ